MKPLESGTSVPARSSGTRLELVGLRKIYGGTTDAIQGGIRDATFTLAPGAFYTLLGPSGCGKTTTLRCIAGLEIPDAGLIRLGGQTFFDAAAGVSVPVNRRNIGMVFQSYAIWPHMTVFENVAFPLRVSRPRRGNAEIGRLVRRALDIVSLTGLEARSATRLSGGQQQRVALARAIVHEPSLLLLDEPLSNLDSSLREEMRRELKRLQQQVGITTIYVTHDQTEALEMSDMIAVINAGDIVQIGTPRDIYDHPGNTFVAEFIGTTNLLPGMVEESVAAGAMGAVRVETGQLLQCTMLRSCAAGETVSVSIRPEALRVVPSGSAATQAANRLEGVVETAGFLGNVMRYDIRCADRLMQVRVGPDVVHHAGDRVAIEFAAASALVIPR